MTLTDSKSASTYFKIQQHLLGTIYRSLVLKIARQFQVGQFSLFIHLVRLENELSDIFALGKLFREASNGSEHGITINGQPSNHIRYADDTVLLTDSAQGLQNLIDNIVEASYEYRLQLNSKKI